MKKKILIGFIMDGKSGGIDKYLLNLLENIWTEDLQIDFLSNEVNAELETYLKKYHSTIYPIANLRHPFSQYRQVKNLIEKEGYEIVYLNISTAIDCIAAIAAKKCRVPRILLHSHSSGNDCETIWKRKILDGIHKFCRLFFFRFGTEYYGCSIKAGEWMFPKKLVNSNQFSTIFNAVDSTKFVFQEKICHEVRSEFGLEEKFVIGHVGNFCYQKNHYFLVDIFEELHRQCPEAVLMLAGQGIRFEQVQRKVREKNLEDAVIFTGFRSDAYRLFQGMDFFLLPSNFEGLPTVGVEAQCSGLPCVMSDVITREAKITSNCWFLSLKEKPEKWAEFILAHRNKKRTDAQWVGNPKNYSLEHLKQQQRELLL